MNTNTYVALVAGTAFALAALILSLAIGIQDYTGSQTRIGGYLESEFAPTQNQAVFATPLFRTGKSAEDYDKYYDIVVIGDSFTEDTTSSWLNFLARDLSASALFLHIDKIDMGDLLNHQTFRERPPKHLILETYEGRTFSRFSRLRRLAGTEPLSPPKVTLPLMAEAREPTRLVQSTASEPTDLKTSMGIAAHYLRNEVKRVVVGHRGAWALRIDLDCETCFSHTRQSSVLIGPLKDEVSAFKFHLRDKAVEGIETLSAIVEPNGWTEINTLVFPRKINIYQRYTKITEPPTIFNDKLPVKELKLIPLLGALKQAVEDGVVDVYAPHDHHATNSGYRIVARIVGDVLAGTSEK